MPRTRALKARPTYQADAAYLLKLADSVSGDARIGHADRAALLEHLGNAVGVMVKVSQALNRGNAATAP